MITQEKTAPSDLIVCTPTISTSPAYSTGDQLGDLQTISGGARLANGTCTLESIVIIDKDSQNAPIDIMFFNSAPTISSSDNSAANISDSELASKLIGIISVTESYCALSANSSVTKSGIMQQLKSASNNGDLYALAVIRGSATYLSTSSLIFKYGFLQD